MYSQHNYLALIFIFMPLISSSLYVRCFAVNRNYQIGYTFYKVFILQGKWKIHRFKLGMVSFLSASDINHAN